MASRLTAAAARREGSIRPEPATPLSTTAFAATGGHPGNGLKALDLQILALSTHPKVDEVAQLLNRDFTLELKLEGDCHQRAVADALSPQLTAFGAREDQLTANGEIIVSPAGCLHWLPIPSWSSERSRVLGSQMPAICRCRCPPSRERG